MSSPNVIASADQAAADWFVAHDRGLTEAERAHFETWRDASPVNAEAWRHAQFVMSAYSPAEEQRLADMRHAALAVGPSVWQRWPAMAIAAAAAVLLVIGAASWKQVSALIGPGRTSPEIASVAAPAQYEAQSKTIDVALDDGSRVQLDAHTKLDVHMLPSRRDLALNDGRAFFRVAHDANRPFVVTAHGMTVTATGTAFGVSVDDDGMLVILESGHVRVASNSGDTPPIELKPGQEYRLRKGQATIGAVDVGSALAWREGLINLKDTPVSEALRDLNRYSAIKVSVGDPAAGALRVTGRFPYDNAPAFAEALSSMYPVHVQHRRDGTQVVASNPN